MQVSEVNEVCEKILAELGPRPDQDSLAKLAAHTQNVRNIIQQQFDAKLIKINARFGHLPENPLTYPWLRLARRLPPGEQREATGIVEWFHSERHGEPLGKTLERENSGDLEAFHMVQHTQEDLFRIGHGKGLSTKFQGDPHHRDLLQLLLCFGGEKLTAEELADCFEEHCPCEKEHDPDALKKQRARLVKELRRAVPAQSQDIKA